MGVVNCSVHFGINKYINKKGKNKAFKRTSFIFKIYYIIIGDRKTNLLNQRWKGFDFDPNFGTLFIYIPSSFLQEEKGEERGKKEKNRRNRRRIRIKENNILNFRLENSLK